MNNHFIPFRAVLLTLLAALLVFLIPMLQIAAFNVPAADDFSFSCETHAAVTSGGSMADVLAGAAEKAGKVYFTWQGSFSAVFLMAFQPAVWSLRHYALTTWIMVLSLLIGVYFFFHRVLHGIFRTSGSIAAISATVVAMACTQFLPSPNQSFYWYNGAVYYTFTFAVMLVLFADVAGYLLCGGWWRIASAAVLCVIVGGSNYITALFSCTTGTLLLVILTLKKDRRRFTLLIPYIVLAAAFLLSVSAPGNAIRQGLNAEHPNAAGAVLLSFRAAAVNVLHWADLRFAACMLFLLPFLWAGTQQSDFSFPMPGAVSGFSFCLFASLFTPHLYALGSDGPERLKNILYFSFIILSVLNLFWWAGWIQRKRKRSRSSSYRISIGLFGIFSACAALCLACSVLLFHGTVTSVAAFSELRSGDAQRYYAQAEERQKALENPEIKDCAFSPFSTTPYILYFTDMTEDPDYYANRDTANFYGKDSIIVE